MSSAATPHSTQSSPAFSRSRGDIYEGVAFTFCKAATLALLFQLLAGPRYILPAVALGTCILYILMVWNKRFTTRCILGPPWVIVTFWGAVAGLALWLGTGSRELPSLLGLLRP